MPLPSDLTLLKNAPVEFMTKYAVSPPNLYNGGTLPGSNAPVGATPFDALRGKNEVDALMLIKDDKRIAYSRLQKQDAEQYDLMIYADSQLNPQQKQDLLPVWYLPWRADRITKIQIQPLATNPTSPSLFFTSALSGCSIFVKGSPAAPMVYHAGTDQMRTAPKLDPNAAVHWQMLFDQYSPNTPNRKEINKGHYMGDQNSTSDLNVYMNFLKNSAKGKVVIGSIEGAGTVFVARDTAGNWSFYLQQKVKISYRTFTIKRKFGIVGAKEQVFGDEKTYFRPMQVTKFFPDGSGHAKLWNTEPFVVPT